MTPIISPCRCIRCISTNQQNRLRQWWRAAFKAQTPIYHSHSHVQLSRRCHCSDVIHDTVVVSWWYVDTSTLQVFAPKRTRNKIYWCRHLWDGIKISIPITETPTTIITNSEIFLGHQVARALGWSFWVKGKASTKIILYQSSICKVSEWANECTTDHFDWTK